MSSPYLRPTQPDTLRDLQRRLDTLERNISRSMIVTPGVGVHIPGTLTVGNTPDSGGGGGAQISAGTPDVPTGFNSVAGADDENVWIDLTWAFPDGSIAPIAAFEVRWKRSADTDYQFATTSNSENYRINGLVGNTGYDTGIRSISTLGAASVWVTDTVTTGADAVAPAQVTGVTVATGNKTQMGTWDSNTESDLSHYLINVATSNSVDGAGKFNAGLVVDGEISFATVVTIDGLDGTGDTYYWQVAAVDRSGNQGTYSATASNTTVLIESAWISSLVADKITSGSIAAQTIELTNSAASIIQSETYSAGSLGWQITGDGNAEFNQVTVRGALEGATIDIGGTDSTSFHVDISGNMWLGAGTFASAPFRVANNGDMDVGGTDSSSWHVDSTGNMWWGSSASYGGASIRISNSGVVEFTTGSFTGDITADSFATGTSGRRITIESGALDDLRFYSNTGTTYGVITSPASSPGSMVIAADAVGGSIPQILLWGDGASVGQITLAPDTGKAVNITNNLDVTGTSSFDSTVTLTAATGVIAGTDIRIDCSSDLFLDGASTVQIHDSGTEYARFTYTSSVGKLQIQSGNSTEGGELELDHGTSGSIAAIIDNFWSGSLNQLRILGGATTIAKIDVGTRLYNKGATGGRDLHIGATDTIHWDTSTARHKQNIRDWDFADMVTRSRSLPRAKLYEALPEFDGGDGATQIGWVAEEIAQVFPDACWYDPDENGDPIPVGINYKRLVPVLFDLVNNLTDRLEAAGL